MFFIYLDVLYWYLLLVPMYMYSDSRHSSSYNHCQVIHIYIKLYIYKEWESKWNGHVQNLTLCSAIGWAFVNERISWNWWGEQGMKEQRDSPPACVGVEWNLVRVREIVTIAIPSQQPVFCEVRLAKYGGTMYYKVAPSFLGIPRTKVLC